MFNPNIIAPQRPVIIAPMVTLECACSKHMDELFALIDNNRDYLGKWLPWVDTHTTPTDTQNFINNCMDNGNQGWYFTYTIRVRSFLVGVLEIRWHDTHGHGFDDNRYVHMRFWIGKKFQGFGIITHAVMVMTTHLFSVYGVNRIGIACASENIPPQQVATGAGYSYIKTIPNAETLSNGNCVDHKIYCQTPPIIDAIKG